MADFPLYVVAFFLFQNAPNVFYQPLCLFIYSFILFSGPFHSKKNFYTFTGGLFYGIGVWTKTLIKTS